MKRLPFIVAKRGQPVGAPRGFSQAALAKRLAEVIQQAYTKPFSLQSDFARSNAFFVAAAASLGYITTRVGPKSHHYGHLWRTTSAGLRFLEKD